MEIAKKLREIRILRNLTQHQVASLTGIGYKSINNYETGASRPDIEKLSMLCSLYDVSADYFLNPFYNNERGYNFYLTVKEQQLIRNFRKLDKYSQNVISILTEAELRRKSDSSIELNDKEITIKEMDKEMKFYLNADEKDKTESS